MAATRRGVMAMNLNRTYSSLAMIVLLVIITIVLLLNLQKTSLKSHEAQQKFRNMVQTVDEYKQVSSATEKYKRNMFAGDRNTAIAMEELLSGLNLKEKMSGIKPTVRKKTDTYTLEGIALDMERLTLRELIDLLAAIGKGREGFILRSLKIKKDFSQSERLNAFFEVSALKSKTE
jgi:hypothetical protein